jgi:hypothetical protein
MLKVVGAQFIHIEVDLVINDLVLARTKLESLDVVCLVRAVEHSGNIICVQLLSHTSVKSSRSRNRSVQFEINRYE